MKFVLFRLIQLLKRETETIDLLSRCFAQKRELLFDGNATGTLAIIENEKRLINEISMIERDKQEEIAELADALNIQHQSLSLSKVLQYIKHSNQSSAQVLIGLINEIFWLLEKFRPSKASHNKRLRMNAAETIRTNIRAIDYFNHIVPAYHSAAITKDVQPEIKIVDDAI